MNDDVPILKPVLKWVGGKTQIIHEIMQTFPTEITDYHEPFLGGGSVLLAVLSHVRAGKITVTGTIRASDLNDKLVSMYENIRTDCQSVIEHLREVATAFAACRGTTVHRRPETLAEATTSRESYYYWTRSIYNDMTPEERRSPRGSATLIFLNKTCFRGIYREGPNGFNVPFGHYKNPTIYDPDHLLAVSDLIRGVVFRHASFADSLSAVRRGSFVYLDPPYAPANATSFVGYTEDGFVEKDHKFLFELCDTLAKTGVALMMSNADVPFVRTNFPADRYRTTVVSCRRAINARNPASRANEVIVSSI